jgi:hypothetical protein
MVAVVRSALTKAALAVSAVVLAKARVKPET